MDATIITIGFLISRIVLFQYVFRFQRTTLGITRLVGGGRRTVDLQVAMTPDWVGTLGWISTLAMIVAGFMVWRTWGWLPLGGFALYVVVLAPSVDVISPFPTYRHCFQVIERVLERDGQTDLLKVVHGIKDEYVGGPARSHEDGQ